MRSEVDRHYYSVPYQLFRDVVVDVDRGRLPGGELVRAVRQRPPHRPLQLLEQAAARALELLEGPLVEPLQPLADGEVGLGDRDEAPVAQAGQNPALGDQNSGFDFGLIECAPT